MQRLKGKTILIGKDPAQRCLCIAVEINGQKRFGAIGNPGSVPGSVSRIRPAEGIAHAAITVDPQGNLTLTNLKPQNLTYVNDSEIISKRITETSRVALGFEKYPLDIERVLSVAKKLAGPEPEPEKPTCDISPLRDVWNRFHESGLDLKRRQKRLGLLASASLIFSLGSGALSVLSHDSDGPMNKIAPTLTVIGFIVCALSFYLRSKDNSIEEGEAALDEFQENYVCPNCGKFLGNYKYSIMKKQYDMRCPHCKCQFVEK